MNYKKVKLYKGISIFSKIVKIKKTDIEARLGKLGLKEDLIALFKKFINPKFYRDAVDIYDDLKIVRESINTSLEVSTLIKVNGRSFDVSLEMDNREFVHFCTCAHREDSNGCEHAGAILVWKFLQGKSEFTAKPKALLKSKKEEQNSGRLGYFRDLFPVEVRSDKKFMIYFNLEDFDSDSQILRLQKGVIKNDGGYGIPMKFSGKDFDYNKLDISKHVKRALSYVITGESFGMGHSSNGFTKTRFYDVNTDLMMPVLKDLYFEEQEVILGATFSREDFRVVWDIVKEKNEYVLTPYFVSGKEKVPLLDMRLFELGANSLWVFDADRRIFYGHKEKPELAVIKNLIRFPKILRFNDEELRIFFTKYYQKVLDAFEVNVSEDLRRESKSIIPKPKLYLEKAGTTIKVHLRFDYAGREVDYFSTHKEIIVIEGDTIFDIDRDFEHEEHISEILNGLKVVTHEIHDEFILEEDLVDFVVNTIPAITAEGIEIFGEDKLFTFAVNKNKGKMSLELSEGTDWFDIKGEVSFGRDSVALQDVLDAIFKNQRFVELSNGKQAVVPKEWVKSLQSYRGFLNTDEKGSKLSKYHLAILDSLITLSSKTKMDKSVTTTVDRFQAFDKIEETPLSKNVKAKLRAYQKAGFDWMNFLRTYDFNGVLADDMGLGKTLQALTILQKAKDEKVEMPSLIVVPTSLVFNWKKEIEQFTPGMKVYAHHGSSRVKGKTALDKKVAESDLIITTYGILRNDLELFMNHEFEYVILDEAHIIKNPMSISAKSVYALRAKHRLALTGTPIQNNLTELWSLFHFLNPGYLGTYDSFRENFVIEIEKKHNVDTSNALKKMINPFLLRRTKQIISDELPAKTEMILKSTFAEGERETYDQYKAYYMNEIKQSIKTNGMGKSHLKILEGLTKLRQICLHPRMVDTSYRGPSGKFDLLLMEIEKVVKEGHKVLVFSSFVKMLTLIREELENRGIGYAYLDGKTMNRERVVEDFQNSTTAKPFLISMKAGGVGLNLTSADYVFIVDPWWNPAVEMQAMDRAHRIGQKNPVFVYKMIAEDTIEEKILEMQKNKKKLVDELITEEDTLMKTIDNKVLSDLFN
ncbi:MAG: non-specific serine/threonine protein kinase [Patescibacteria group bacterium]